jgi:hypothetical protein
MARRYIGDAVITIMYHDAGSKSGRREDYRGSVRAGGYTWKFDELHAPAMGFSFASDSPEAYDKMAASAVSFGSYYTTHNRGDDVPDWAPPAKVADAIDEATVWAMTDSGRYQVRRSRDGDVYASEAGMRRNPLPGGDTAVLIGLGVLVLGGIGYAIYKASQPATGGTLTSGLQTMTLGPGGTNQSDGTTVVGSTAYGPEASTAPPVSDSYEAG